MDPRGYIRLDHAEPERTADDTLLLKRAPVNVPLNLIEWFPSSQLIAWIEESLPVVEESSQPDQKLAPAFEARRKLLLSLLTLAYASKLFRSREIIQTCATDPLFKSLCEGQVPYLDELEHFRRANRAELTALLGQVLYRAVAEKFHFAPGTVPAGLQRDLLIRAEERVDIARHMNTWDE